MKLVGLGALDKALKKHIKDFKLTLAEKRRLAITTLVQELAINIPVWSGRTIESIRIANSPVYAALQGAPNPTDSLGEQNRASATAAALAQVAKANYMPERKVFLTIHSEAWGLVEIAQAPRPGAARNKAVVSQLAIAAMKAKHPYVR